MRVANLSAMHDAPAGGATQTVIRPVSVRRDAAWTDLAPGQDFTNW
jgi:hypothetical protein